MFIVPDMCLKKKDDLSAFGCLSLSGLTLLGKFLNLLLLITKCFDDFVIFKNVPYKRCKSGFD
jgi:hypothetical protein